MSIEQESSLVSFGRRLGRHAGLYASGSVATFVFALANMAVLTRLLSLDQFGQLAIFLLFATLLTVVYNLGSLQGVFIWVFGASDGGEEGVEDEADQGLAESKERALFSGLLLTIAITILGTAAVFATAPLWATILGAPGQVEAVRIAALCGATGSVWRLVHNVLRFERRPIVYTILGIVRPVLALVLGVGLVVAGYGVEGALAGIAIGTALAVPVALAVSWRSYEFGYCPGTVSAAFGRGAFFVPIMISMWVIGNADLYLVSQYTSEEEVGPYRVASRLGAGTSYLVSAVLMSWMPLSKTPLYEAVTKDHGSPGFGATLLTAFLLFCIWVVLGLTLLADVLIRIAPESYSGAAPLVPLIALGVVSFGVFRIVQRSGVFDNKRWYFLGAMLGAMILFIPLGMLLVPRFGGYGAAAAQIIAFSAAAAVMLWKTQRSEEPLPIPYRRLGRGVILGLLCIALGQLVAPLAGEWRFVIDLGIVVAFPFLLIAVRAFPREELSAFVDVAIPVMQRRRTAKMLEQLEQLDPHDRRTVALLTPSRSSSAEVSRVLDLPEPEILVRFVTSLRTLSTHAADSSGERDLEIAHYLLAESGVATRDQLGRELCADGVDPFELDILDVTLVRLRRIPRHDWERAIS